MKPKLIEMLTDKIRENPEAVAAAVAHLAAPAVMEDLGATTNKPAQTDPVATEDLAATGLAWTSLHFDFHARFLLSRILTGFPLLLLLLFHFCCCSANSAGQRQTRATVVRVLKDLKSNSPRVSCFAGPQNAHCSV